MQIMTPYFKFNPQIQLKESSFYTSIYSDTNVKGLLVLNNRFFRLNPIIKLYSNKIYKQLPGGFNSILIGNKKAICNILSNHPLLKTQLVEKKIIEQNVCYSMESLKSVCSLIFYIVLNNYILFYQQVI
jgi:hypothetical protein